MINNILILFINIIFSVLSYLMIIRFLIQWSGVPFINPFAQIIAKASTPLIRPFSYIVGTYKNINFSVILLAILLEAVHVIVLVALLSHSFPDVGGLLLWAIAVLLQKISNILLYGTVIYALMSWFPSLTNSPLGQCIIIVINPFVQFFRRFIPAFGGLDFSAMAFVIVMILIRMFLQPLLLFAISLALA